MLACKYRFLFCETNLIFAGIGHKKKCAETSQDNSVEGLGTLFLLFG